MSIERTLPAGNMPSRVSPGAVCWLLFVCLIVALLCAPFLRVVLWTADEGLMLGGAQRIVLGESLYVDFFEAAPPGGFLFTAAWLGTFGLSLGSARLLALLTLVGIAGFTHLACLRASKNAKLSAGLAIGCIAIPLSQKSLAMMTIHHHWFTTLFSMAAVFAALVAVERPAPSKRWPLISGLFGGMAAMVVPNCGAFAVLAGAVGFWNLRKYRVEMIAYVIGVLVIPSCLLAYIIEGHKFIAAFNDIIIFPFTRYSSIQGVPFAAWANNVTRPLKYFYPLTALLALIVYVRGWQIGRPDRVLRLCVAFAIAGLLVNYPRPEISHIAFSAPLACPLLACCSDRIGRRVRPRYQAMAVAVALLFCLPAIRSYLSYLKEVAHTEKVTSPSGDVVFVGRPGNPELLARIAKTPQADRYFFYPYLPLMPFLAARPQVGPIDIFTPEMTMATQYRDSCISVMRHASWVVIDRVWTDAVWLIVFPSMRNPRPEETARFEHALESGFDLVATDATLELRHRRPDANDALCAGIAD